MAFGSNTRASSLLLLIGATTHHLLAGVGVAAITLDVTADGNGDYDLFTAMDEAEPGDIVSLADGTYDQPIVSVKDGEPGNPITVVGGPGAIINGDYNSRNVLITHSFITLQVRLFAGLMCLRGNGRFGAFQSCSTLEAVVLAAQKTAALGKPEPRLKRGGAWRGVAGRGFRG